MIIFYFSKCANSKRKKGKRKHAREPCVCECVTQFLSLYIRRRRRRSVARRALGVHFLVKVATTHDDKGETRDDARVCVP